MIYRIDVGTTAGSGTNESDPLGHAVRQQIREFGTDVGPITTRRIFLLDTEASLDQVQRIASELLADPVVESASSGAPASSKARIEIHLKPGVMDPVAASTEMAIRDMGLPVREVRTGRAYIFEKPVSRDDLQRIASRVLANGVIESIHFDAFHPAQFEVGRAYSIHVKHVRVRELSDAQLTKLSREGHLFLSLPEMQAIQAYYREQKREPSDIELETIAQTWSEHCVHKTLKSAVDVEVRDETGKVVGSRRYGNLIKETIFASTVELMQKNKAAPFCLSVFKDNAGVVVFDDRDAVCFKVETHNHPSAIEPYGGSATGIGGVIRDILGTGLGAKPIANTDVFCVAFPGKPAGKPEIRNPKSESNPNPQIPMSQSQEESPGTTLGISDLGFDSDFGFRASDLPKGIIHPKRILQQVVAGVRDYGNRMGIPTVNGAVYFDDRYLGNPLVFCGCVGLIPRDKIEKQSRDGDAIVVMGGRTGRDGIHGATFSSAELTDTHADEFSHAVQIGNAITEKKVADVILQARDRNLFTAITDCGAGGLSSAVGEMGEKTGAQVELDLVPLKYAGLRHDEIWISEAQERMVLSVPAEHVEALLALSRGEDVEATVIGRFGTPNQELILRYAGTEVGRLSMHFLHDGIPMPTRKAVVVERREQTPPHPSPLPEYRERGSDGAPTNFKRRLLASLAHPNIASKHWIIRQYDHEVQGGSVIKPLIGPMQIGPSDAAVIRPKLSTSRGIAIGCGMVPHLSDPYKMAIASIDEAIRNIVCVGIDYNQIAILDNFCWPSVDDEQTMGTLVRACEACRDAAVAFGIPFISGKDSLHNQFTNQETGEVLRIPNTLLISALGIVPDVRKCVTMDLKTPANQVVLVAAKSPADLSSLPGTHRHVAAAIQAGEVAAAHDVSDGGIAVSAAEMCIASGLGMKINESALSSMDAFAERPGRYLLELRQGASAALLRQRFADSADVIELGTVQKAPNLTVFLDEIAIADLTHAWRGTLDW